MLEKKLEELSEENIKELNDKLFIVCQTGKDRKTNFTEKL